MFFDTFALDCSPSRPNCTPAFSVEAVADSVDPAPDTNTDAETDVDVFIPPSSPLTDLHRSIDSPRRGDDDCDESTPSSSGPLIDFYAIYINVRVCYMTIRKSASSPDSLLEACSTFLRFAERTRGGGGGGGWDGDNGVEGEFVEG